MQVAGLAKRLPPKSTPFTENVMSAGFVGVVDINHDEKAYVVLGCTDMVWHQTLSLGIAEPLRTNMEPPPVWSPQEEKLECNRKGSVDTP